jgi:hypothetical protein
MLEGDKAMNEPTAARFAGDKATRGATRANLREVGHYPSKGTERHQFSRENPSFCLSVRRYFDIGGTIGTHVD